MKKSNNKKIVVRKPKDDFFPKLSVAPDPITDEERLNWLERQIVNVRTPALYGSFHNFWAGPDDEIEGDAFYPSNIRDQIDKQIQNERQKAVEHTT